MEAVRLTEACHTEGRNGARARSINGGLVQPATGREGRETGGENRVRGRRQAATWLGKKLLVPWTKDIARDIEIGEGGSL